MRGALGENNLEIHESRIIPADAGSTVFRLSVTVCLEDHPRGCGEHFFIAIISLSGWGSSPRMRGARDREGTLGVIMGIIPADAGSTAEDRWP